MDGPVFTHPTIARLTSADWPPDGTQAVADASFEVRPWTAELLLDFLEAPCRALVLMGHHPKALYLGYRPEWPDHLLRVDLIDLTVSVVTPTPSIQAAWPPHTTCAALVEFEPREHQGVVYALPPLESPDPQWLMTEELLFLWTEDLLVLAPEPWAFLEYPVTAFVATAVEACADRYALGELSAWAEEPPLEADRPGLLWLFDPARWYPDYPPEDFGPAVRVLQQIGRDVLPDPDLTERDDLVGFLDGQLWGTQPAARAFEWTSTPALADARAERFLDAVADGGAADEFTALDDTASDALRSIAWFDALALLVEKAVLAPPGLPQSWVVAVGDGSGEVVEPLLASFVGETTIQLELWGEEFATLVRTPPPGSVSSPPVQELFAWEYVPADEEGGTRVLVAAAPGGEVRPAAGSDLAELVLVRLPDVDLVPDLGEQIDPSMLGAAWAREVDQPEYAEFGDPETPPMLALVPRPDGVEFQYFASTTDGSEPIWTSRLTFADMHSGDVGYTFSTDPMVETHRVAAYSAAEHEEECVVSWIRIWVSGEVTIAERATTDAMRTYVRVEYVQVDSPYRLPAWGHPLMTTERGWRSLVTLIPRDVIGARPLDARASTPPGWDDDEANRLGAVQRSPDTSDHIWTTVDWLLTLVDVLVGFVPVVGDVLDIIEFANACGTGKDRWGRPVSGLDLFIMGGCAVLPVVTTGFVRGVGRGSLGLFGGGPEDLLLAPWRGLDDVTEGQAELLSRSRHGWDGLDDASKTALIKMFGELPELAGKALEGELFRIGDILSGNNKAFRIPELQHVYAAWRAAGEAAGTAVSELTPTKFLRATDPTDATKPLLGGRRRAILEALLGPDYWKLADLAGRTRIQKGANWGRLAGFVFRAGAQTVESLATDLLAGNAMRDALSQIARDSASRWIDEIEPFVRGLTPEQLAEVIGRRPKTVADVVELLGEGMQLFDEAVLRSGAAWPDVHAVEGIYSFFKDVVTRSGWEHGSMFEVRGLGALITEGLQGLADEIVDAVDGTISLTSQGLRLQLPMLDNKLGPDIAHYLVDGAGKIVADVFQAKSWKAFERLSGEGAVQETFRQFLSDMIRFNKQGWQVAGPGTKELTAGFSGRYGFLFDFDRLWEAGDLGWEVLGRLAGASTSEINTLRRADNSYGAFVELARRANEFQAEAIGAFWRKLGDDDSLRALLDGVTDEAMQGKTALLAAVRKSGDAYKTASLDTLDVATVRQALGLTLDSLSEAPEVAVGFRFASDVHEGLI